MEMVGDDGLGSARRRRRTSLAEALAGPRGDWTDDARCRGTNSDAFFARSIPDARAALRICERCRVRDDCLEYAVAEGIEIGVWGGLTERQRRAYVRRVAS